ncbi:L-threonylcarbamoyladenylate synthase [Candidatus Fermentibacteria bacterium]|nr:L-threonylcarbamoyladenylate synthase [Candidatus Fermentibacteria bacterium]
MGGTMHDPYSLRRASEILRRGGVVVVPTDTCFGLAADALRQEVVARVLQIKGRNSGKPPAVFVPDLGAVPRVASLSPTARVRAEALLPGPWTLLLPPCSGTPPWLVSPEGLVGIRWTQFQPVADILAASRLLLTATSANASGLAPPYTPAALAQVLRLETVDMVIQGPCGGLPPSTVIDLTTEPPRVVRQASRGYRPGGHE